MSLLTANKLFVTLLVAALSSGVAAQQKRVAKKPNAVQQKVVARSTIPKPAFELQLRDAILAQRWDIARPQLESMAKAGNVDAMVVLGALLVRGVDGVKDMARAEKLLGDAATRGSALARRQLAVSYFKGDFNTGVPQYSKAWNFIYPLAKADDPMGLYLAGKIIRDGLLGSPNEQAGREMILRAALRGWPEAQRELASFATVDLNTDIAERTKENAPVSAMTVMKSAANKGNVEAIWQLGLAHLFGIGVESNQAEAKKWFEKGKAHQDVAAMLMALHLSNEPSLPPPVVAAVRRNPLRASLAYGIMARQLAEGRGADLDLDKAGMYALISGYLGASDSFEIIASIKSKLSADAFAKAEENFRAWRAEILPAN